MSKNKEDFKLVDFKDPRFNLLAAAFGTLLIGGWTAMRKVESNIAEISASKVVPIEKEIKQELKIMNLRIDSLQGIEGKTKEYCQENIKRIERRLEYVERRSVNPFKPSRR